MFPLNVLDADSYAFGLQFGGNADSPMPRKIGADACFDRYDADRFEVHEQTMRTGPDETLTLTLTLTLILILVSDPKMLEEQEERGNWRR